MSQFKCSICGYVHEEETGGLFNQLPEDWVCPWCKAAKTAFVSDGQVENTKEVDEDVLSEEYKELSSLEVSVICSNLARGCEKQYMAEESLLFKKLATYFKSISPKGVNEDTVQSFVAKDLTKLFPLAKDMATKHGDRGALRALTWSEKVTMILQALLDQYEKVGEEMISHTGVYVCTICGFIYIGDTLPEVCPICKVSNEKFTEMKDDTSLMSQYATPKVIEKQESGKNGSISRLYAVRSIPMCTKDCLCLYVCPTGASDTENSVIDMNKCIGCTACVNACPSKAISLVPRVLPPQQKHEEKVLLAMKALFASKVHQENIASINGNKLFVAIERSNRIMAEDFIRESGYMLPQSGNTHELLKKLLANSKGINYPMETINRLLEILKVNEK